MAHKMTVAIEKIKEESPTVRTFFFRGKLNAKPGQFVMAGIPSKGEKPFSISMKNERSFGITIKRVGDFTNTLFNLKVGDLLSIRGPYGTHFTEQGKKALIIAGGVGMAPLLFLLEELLRDNHDVTVINGARTKEELLFVKRIEELSKRVIFVTDDGTYGVKGFVTDVLKELLQKERFDIVYGAGPEMMLVKTFRICDEFDTQCKLSLERYMKCGIGICGSCVMDPIGLRVCKDGPVIKKEILSRLTEFGNYKRDASGRKVFFEK